MHAIDQTDGCIFGGNSPFHGIQEPELRSVVHPVHTDKELAIDGSTVLITVMHANNETGTLQPLKEIAEIAQRRGVLLHTDAAQSVGKIATRVNELGIDLLTIAGHKVYAP